MKIGTAALRRLALWAQASESRKSRGLALLAIVVYRALASSANPTAVSREAKPF